MERELGPEPTARILLADARYLVAEAAEPAALAGLLALVLDHHAACLASLAASEPVQLLLAALNRQVQARQPVTF